MIFTIFEEIYDIHMTIIIASNNMLEGTHDIWDFILDSDVTVQKNWGKFILSYLSEGIRRFKTRKGTYMQRCLLFIHVA